MPGPIICSTNPIFAPAPGQSGKAFLIMSSIPSVKEISPPDLDRMRRTNEAFQLVDLREPYEAEICSLGGELIPMAEIIDRLGEIRRDIPVVMHCRSGNRAAAVVQALTARYGFSNVFNLRGGITAYGLEVDDAMHCD